MDYNKIIADYRRLSRADERTLFEVYNNGNKKDRERAFQILFLSNVYMVSYVAGKFMWKADYAELLQQGMLVLFDVIPKFDNTGEFRHVRFSVYLHRAISSRLQRYIDRYLIPIPMVWSNNKSAIYQAFKVRKHNGNFNPNSSDWLQEFSEENPQHSIENIRAVAQYVSPPAFLGYDSPANSRGEGLILAEVLPDKKIRGEEAIINKIDFQRIREWVKERFPDEIDQAIIEDRFFSDEPQSNTVLGDRFSITKEAIRKRYNKIVGQLQEQFGEQFTGK
ncbi:MAG: hypothetical protein OXB86_02825 [Bdellovibrionales bacterium]|nr:hypothetical protein [Bdellovibrionales bacterium]